MVHLNTSRKLVIPIDKNLSLRLLLSETRMWFCPTAIEFSTVAQTRARPRATHHAVSFVVDVVNL